MDVKILIGLLESNSRRILALVDAVSSEQARWRPSPESWSILEVVNHLYDEEQFDFRVRLNNILYHPTEPWPPIDPQGWVVSRKYNDRILFDSTQKFLAERQKSLEWLNSLTSADWEADVPAPWGSITAGDMFVSWVAHDFLHLRQLVELLHDYAAELSKPYQGEYAGDW